MRAHVWVSRENKKNKCEVDEKSVVTKQKKAKERYDQQSRADIEVC